MAWKLALIGALGITLAALCPPPLVSARKQGELSYPYEQVWNAALRMVRVDLRLPVTDRDAEAGYLLFEYIDHDKHYPGSVELVRDERGARPVTRAVIQVSGMPGYVEQMLFDRLGRKLRDEYGEPLEPPKPDKPKPKPSEDLPPAEDEPPPS